MKNYKQFLELQKQLKKYADGGQVEDDEAKSKSFDAKSQAVLRAHNHDSNAYKWAGFPIDAEPKMGDVQLDEHIRNKYANGGQVQESQQEQYQAKDYFGKGSNGAGEGVANSMGIRMADGGEVKKDDSSLSEVAKMFKQAFSTPTPPPTPEETQEEKYEKIRRKNRENFGYAKGGSVEQPHDKKNLKELEASFRKFIAEEKKEKYSDGGSVDGSANTASSLSPLLKEAYASKKKKKGYAGGGGVQPFDYDAEQNNPDLTPEETQAREQELQELRKKGIKTENVQGDEQNISVDQGPYPGEEEDATKAADMTTDANIGLLDRIDNALGDKKPEVQSQVSEEAPAKDQRNLEGLTLNKDEALKENPEKENKVNISPEEEAKLLEEPKTEEKPYDPITALNEAQNRRNTSQMWNQIGAAAERGAAGYAGIKPTQQETYKENMAIAQQAVDDVKDRIKQQGDDPNSMISRNFRQYLEKFSGHPVDPHTTANSGKEVLPMIFKDYEAKEAQKTRAAIASERAAERLQQTQMITEQRRQQAKEHNDLMRELGQQKLESGKQAKVEKQEKSDLDRVDKMNKMISEDIATSRSAFGVAARNKQSVENIKALLDGQKDPNDLDNRQVVEVARVLDRVLSGGQATISGSEHLTPDSARQWLAKKWEFITSKRQGAGAGSFVKTMTDTIDREGHMADKQIKAAQGKMMGPYQSLAKNDKDSKSYQNYVATLKAHGLDALLPKDEQEQPQEAAPKAPAAPGKPSAQPGKKVVRKGYNAKTNQTQLIYDDGSKEIVEGRQ